MNGAARAVLDERGCRKIHEAALTLLEEVGCAVLDPEALALLQANGARVDGERARFGEALVERARSTAPARYTVAGRRPELDLHVGLGEPAVLASASGPPFVLSGGRYRTGTLEDLTAAVRLAHLSPNIDVLGYSVEPGDVPEERRPKVVAHLHATSSDKNCRYTVTSLSELQVATDVLEILHGADWHARSRLWSVVNTTSPLQFSAEGAQVLLRLARLGQPVLVAVCAMGGTTAPITLAGLLAVQHAELLVGLVLTQLANEGTPFLYGGTSSLSSMQSGALMIGAPAYWSLMEATVRLGHWLGVPVRAGGSVTDAHLPDAQAGIESALAMDTVLRTGAQYVLHAAGILSSFNCFSPEKFVIDDEVISGIRVARRPIEVDDETLALDVVKAAGPGGTVLGQRTHAQARARRHPPDDHEPRALRDLAVTGRRRSRRRSRRARRRTAGVLRAAGRPRPGGAAAARRLLPGLSPDLETLEHPREHPVGVGEVDVGVHRDLDGEPVDDGAEELGQAQQVGVGQTRSAVLHAEPLELRLPVPAEQHGHPAPQHLVAHHVRQQLVEDLEVLDRRRHAPHLLDQARDALARSDVLHPVQRVEVLVVDHGVEHGGDESGLVVEVVGDHRLVLAGAFADGLERERLEPLFGDDLLGRDEQVLRRLRAATRAGLRRRNAGGRSADVSPSPSVLQPPGAIATLTSPGSPSKNRFDIPSRPLCNGATN